MFPDTGMTTVIGVPGEEVAVEVLIDMIVIGMGGIGIIIAGARAAALVLITIGSVVEVTMMMSFKSEAEADQWISINYCFVALVLINYFNIYEHVLFCTIFY